MDIFLFVYFSMQLMDSEQQFEGNQRSEEEVDSRACLVESRTDAAANATLEV